MRNRTAFQSVFQWLLFALVSRKVCWVGCTTGALVTGDRTAVVLKLKQHRWLWVPLRDLSCRVSCCWSSFKCTWNYLFRSSNEGESRCSMLPETGDFRYTWNDVYMCQCWTHVCGWFVNWVVSVKFIFFTPNVKCQGSGFSLKVLDRFSLTLLLKRFLYTCSYVS